MNSDGTWSYVSILDPVIADGDYRVQHTMESKYGPAKGEEYAKAYKECYGTTGRRCKSTAALRLRGRSRLQREPGVIRGTAAGSWSDAAVPEDAALD